MQGKIMVIPQIGTVLTTSGYKSIAVGDGFIYECYRYLADFSGETFIKSADMGLTWYNITAQQFYDDKVKAKKGLD